MAVLHNNANRDFYSFNMKKIYYYELVTGMDFGSEMLSVDHADISNYENRLTQDLPFKERRKDGR